MACKQEKLNDIDIIKLNFESNFESSLQFKSEEFEIDWNDFQVEKNDYGSKFIFPLVYSTSHELNSEYFESEYYTFLIAEKLNNYFDLSMVVAYPFEGTLTAGIGNMDLSGYYGLINYYDLLGNNLKSEVYEDGGLVDIENGNIETNNPFAKAPAIICYHEMTVETEHYVDWYQQVTIVNNGATTYIWVFVESEYVGTTYETIYYPEECSYSAPGDNHAEIHVSGYLDFAVSGADYWEEEICKKAAFANNNCVNGIWEIMKQNDVGFETLKNFLGSKPLAELCLDIKDLGSTVNGNTQKSGTSITVSLNSNKLNRSKLSIARTLLHEMIHAELYSMVIEAGGYDQLQSFAANYQGEDDFMMLWEYYEKYGDNMDGVRPGWQHEYMAEYYIEYIAQGLKELHPYLSSQAFINYRTGSFVGNSDIPWSWDDFFIALAWEGLKGEELNPTNAYQIEVINKGLEEIYKFYASAAIEESSTNKCY